MKQNCFYKVVVMVVALWICLERAPSEELLTLNNGCETILPDIYEERIVYRHAKEIDLLLTPNENGLTIIRLKGRNLKNQASVSLIIPEEVEGRKVTKIGEEAFFHVTNLVSVDIPDSVEEIGRAAFGSCSSLRNVVLPSGLKNLEEAVFAGCEHLESIFIPEKVTSIGKRACANCYRLESVVMGNSVRTIGERAFYSCYNLNTVVLPDSVETIGSKAFMFCGSLKSINIPKNLEAIPERFVSSSSVEEIVVPDGVKTIGDFAFALSKLKRIRLGKNVETVNSSAFYGFKKTLESVSVDSENRFFQVCDDALITKDGKRLVAAFANDNGRRNLPEGLARIENYAFSNEQPSIISIPKTVQEIGERAFENRLPGSSLTIIVDKDNPNFKTVDGALLTKGGGRLLQVPLDRRGAFTIPQGVEVVDFYAFRYASFERITIPGSLKKLKNQVFEKLANLEEIVVEEGVEEIYGDAFSGCKNIKRIVIPRSVKNIADNENLEKYKVLPLNSPLDSVGKLSGATEKTMMSVPKGSYAEKWAIEQKMKYETVD